jgi:hypothetical protein
VIRLLGPTPADVLAVAAELTGLPADVIGGPKRSALVTRARLVTCWAMRDCTSASFPEIGVALNRNHCTVMSNCDYVSGHPDLLRAARAISEATQARHPANPTSVPPSCSQPDAVTIDLMEYAKRRDSHKVVS